jgi:tetratricopeptide (TPR) repeat protein
MGSTRALALAVILASSAVASAQPTAQQKQEASELVKKAIAKSQAGDHDSAVELYLNAYQIIPQPLLLSNIGSEYQQMQKPVEALKYFCKYLEADGPQGDNAGYATAQAKTLYIELGGVSDVTDEDVCKPIVKPAPVLAPTPPPNPTLTETQPIAGPVDSGPKTSPLRYVGLGVGVAGAAVFGVGVYYGLHAKSISDDITNHPTDLPWEGDIKAREQEGKDAEKKQVIFMVGGGAAVVAGAALFFIMTPKQPTETGVVFAPMATPESMGIAASGRF